MLTFEYQFTYKFSCTIARHYTETDREKIEGSFDAYYQLTDQEIKFKIMNYVPVGYCSVADFEWIIVPYKPKDDIYNDL